jgi:sterol desaturase/sphingolipid hydroxylase (fatty acid hydroxylase superfamily)
MPAWGDMVARWSLPAAGVAFFIVTVLEAQRPRDAVAQAGSRWATNFTLYAAIFALGLLVAPHRLIAWLLAGWDGGPMAWIGRGAGPWAELAAGLLVLDALAYALHRMQHGAWFWRFHAVHHADTMVDATTGLRHHPGEYLINAVVGGLVLGAAGLAPWIASLYALLAILSDLWSHANLALPRRMERALGWVIVTPGVHRLHHSDQPEHFNANFGAVLTVWDRLFRTWRPATEKRLRFGVRGTAAQGLLAALRAPFARSGAGEEA